jgi:hypothetical protein
MPIMPPARPQKGQKISPNFFPDLYDYIVSLEVRGDLKTTTARRTNAGTTITANNTGGGANGQRTSSYIAKITADNNDGTYDADEQECNAGTFQANTDEGIEFGSATNDIGYLYELNGLQGVPVGTFVVVHKVNDVSGDPIWYFDGQQVAYGADGPGAWVEITGESSGAYSWKQKDLDATTDASPSVTGSANAYDVNSTEGIPSGTIVWLIHDGTNYRFEFSRLSFWAKITGETSGAYSWTELQGDATTTTSRTGTTNASEVSGRLGIPTNSIVRMFPHPTDNTDYQFEYHGAVDVTPKTLSSGTSTTANTDTWLREVDKVGVVYIPFRIATDSTTGIVYGFKRTITEDANGHLLAVGAEVRSVIMTLDPTAITCTTELDPTDSSISSGLVADWNAEDIAQADGTAVTTWTDNVGSIAATQATAAKKPTYKTAVYNGKAAVRFDGSDDYLDAGRVAALELSSYTIVGVWKKLGAGAGSSADQVFNNYGYDGSNSHGYILDANSSYTGALYNYTGSGGVRVLNYTTSDGIHVIAATHQTASGAIFEEGVSKDTDSVSTAVGYDTTNKVMFGERWLSGAPAGEYGNVDICRILVYNSVLSDEQIEQISCWAITEYGI